MQLSFRRKFFSSAASAGGFFSSASAAMKPTSSTRKGGNLSVFVVISSIFLFGCFMYNEDVKSLAEFPFSRPKSITDTATATATAATTAASTTTFSVLINARTVVESEIETDDESERKKPKSVDGTVNLKIDGSNPSDHEEEEEEEDEDDEEIQIPPPDCDLFDGDWVFDNFTHPIYKEDHCEFLTAQVTCLRNGRRDSLYQNWRWLPRHCSLPKFKAKLLLEKLRNKRLMFVGDSSNRNQWESMVCLVQSGVRSGRKSLNKTGSLSIFKLEVIGNL